MHSFSKKNKNLKTEVQPRLSVLAMIMTIAVIAHSAGHSFINLPAAIISFSLYCFCLFRSDSARQSFLLGSLFGAGTSLLLNFWMITVITSYVKGSMLLAILCYICSALVLGLIFGTLSLSFQQLKFSSSTRYFVPKNVFLLAALWFFFEVFRNYAFSSLPWLSFSAGVTMARSLYLIQAAAFGGTALLSFVLITSCGFLAYAMYLKSWKPAAASLVVFISLLLAGILMYSSISEDLNVPENKTFRASIVMPAHAPGTNWNDLSADALVGGILSQAKEASGQNTDLIVWTETVVPWTFSDDDDFLAAMRSLNMNPNQYSLFGMNTANAANSGQLNNSVYLFGADGKVQSRYDKQDLLTFVEKPLFTDESPLILPFLASSGLKMNAGDHKKPLSTPWGKAGILICNESTSPLAAQQAVAAGANFLVNMGNDSWFSKHFIPLQHFYNCRLRAVEARKDVVINNNMGYAGVISADGQIIIQQEARKPGIKIAPIRSNSLPSRDFRWFYTVPGIFIIYTIYSFFKNRTPKQNT